MSDLLDFAGSDALAGFRLQELEVYNWGTFHERVFRFALGGENALLTGDIGSGKSTLVDAVTTLLVPPQRITYNKAAGAETRERSLRSYVLGYYKSERADTGLSARPVALRDGNHHSVILGHFHNVGFAQSVTLAQVFWIKDADGQPARFHVVADGRLSISEHFTGFGKDIKALKKRLRATHGVEVHEAFTAYEASLRRRFNIASEQALELFHQTVSMKSVGNLTDFVRQHMLEAFPVAPRIEALIRHFDDLHRAHEAVLKAKAQVERLAPLVEDARRHEGMTAERDGLRACRDALRSYFAGEKLGLLQKRMSKLKHELELAALRIASQEQAVTGAKRRRDDVMSAIAQNGGDRLEALEREIQALRAEKKARETRARSFGELCDALEMPAPREAGAFLDLRRRIDSDVALADADLATLQNDITEATVGFRDLRRAHDEIGRELESLRGRRSNIEGKALRLRGRLCQELGLPEDELPFAGELLQVHDEEHDWEGALERLLRNFALSLLVSDAHYTRVAAWVDGTHLGERLVYLRVRPQRATEPSHEPRSALRKLRIKPDSEHHEWLEAELRRRFDYVCCETLDELRREQRAVTRAGQIKGGNERHEKDDRHRLDDRSRYVLGWSNSDKIAALEKQARDLEVRITDHAQRLGALQDQQRRARERIGRLQQLKVYDTFQDLDWASLALDIARLEEQHHQLEAASDVLGRLRAELASIEKTLSEDETELASMRKSYTRDELKAQQAQELAGECESLLAQAGEASSLFPRLAELRHEAFGEHLLTVESCDNRESDLRQWIQDDLDRRAKAIERLRDKIVQTMVDYRRDYPLDTQEVDASLEATPAYAQMLDKLRGDDLPRFERRFKELLNENTIREVAGFHSELAREQQIVRERISFINNPMREINYGPGRYIRLEVEPTTDAEVRDFQQELRACTEGSLTGSDDASYSEAKFLAVKAIIERFRGREGKADLDQRWRNKVTDVRNWFTFGASERWREDDREHEHYSDSGGKSGGQKEKLAYTVLAASLAYQFGLAWGEKRSRTFRFVCIDEAFGRGSEDSTRYALELFQRLNLQLLVVTPLQKIHVIEPFVRSVGFVHNQDGERSLLRTLTIEQHLAERAARSA